MFSKDKKILIIGLGLIGGSYAQGLSKKGYQVGALDPNEQSIKYGLDNNIIKWGQSSETKEYIEMFDILIFAVYPHVFIEWVEKYQSYIKSGAIITDAIGIKAWVIDNVLKILRDDIDYVGGHPMAGKEVYGVQNSDCNIFKNANYIITPTKKSNEESVQVVREIGEILEFKNIVVLKKEDHDEMIGFLSQLTHCIAVALMTCKDSEHLVEYTGDSFRDLTRIARINENMWSELFLLNKEELLKQITLFEEQLSKLKQTIEDENVDEMKEIMKLSTLRRSYFDK